MSLRVYVGAKNPSHEISLSDGVQSWGLNLAQEENALKEIPLKPSTVLSKETNYPFGSWAPGLSEVEIRSWLAGRGFERQSEAPEGFADSQMAWTLNGGKLLPGPQWCYATGMRETYEHLPGSLAWQALINDTASLAVAFTVGAAAFAVKSARFWLRRVGSPAELKIALFNDYGGSPDTAIASGNDTVSLMDVTDVISVFQAADLSGAAGLNASTSYHLVLTADSKDNAANHWEVGVDKSARGAQQASEGGSWSASEFQVYHRICGAEIDRDWLFFEYKSGFYAVDARADGSASSLWLNGDRGKASSADSSSLTDSNKNWPVNAWQGAWLKISGGKGKGQLARILSNTATSLSVENWQQTPDSSSDYVIEGTAIWQEISPSSGDLIDGVVTDCAVVNGQVLLAQGPDTAVLKMRWNASASPPAHEFDDDGTNSAEQIVVMSDASNGLQIWRLDNENVAVSKATPTAWGTNLSFGSAVAVADKEWPVLRLFEQQGVLKAFKSDGLYSISADGKVEKSFSIRLRGQAAFSVWREGERMRFGAGGLSLLEAEGAVLREIGPGQREGLPQVRKGQLTALQAAPQGLLAAVDAGLEAYSSMLYRSELTGAWHEVFRSWAVGKRVTGIQWQQLGGGRSRLWLSVGGELLYQDWPAYSTEPIHDPEFHYQHEAVVESGVIDMDAASLPKLVPSIKLVSAQLQSGVAVYLAYQKDEQIGSNTWVEAGAFYRSPEDEIALNLGALRRIRFRLRLLSEQVLVAPIVRAMVVALSIRTPMRYQWELLVRVGENQANSLAGSENPEAFVEWLKATAVSANKVRMHSVWAGLDNKVVLVEPPQVERLVRNKATGCWSGLVRLTVREV